MDEKNGRPNSFRKRGGSAMFRQTLKMTKESINDKPKSCQKDVTQEAYLNLKRL